MLDVTLASGPRRPQVPLQVPPWVSLRRALVTLAALVVCTAALGCTDDGLGGREDPPGETTVAAIRDATAALGAVAVSGTARSGDLEGPVSGTVGAEPSRGVVRHPAFVDGAAPEVELRWDAGTVWIRRAPGGPVDPTDPAALLVRAPEARPWVAIPAGGLGSGLLLVPWDPFVLLDSLSAATLRPAGEEEVGGRTATRYDVDGGAGLVSAVRLWVGGDGVLVRVEADRQGVAVTYDLAPAGGLTVEPPPAEEIAEPGSERRPMPAPELTGPFTVVAEGRDARLTWTLERAPAADGRTCWRFASTPEVPLVDDLTEDGLHCPPVLPDDALLEARVVFVVDSAAGAPAEVVIAELPAGVVAAELVTADGARRDLPVDPGSRVLAYVGPPDPQPVVLTLSTADGARLGCGPGAVTEPADLDTMDADTLLALRDVPWGCFPVGD